MGCIQLDLRGALSFLSEREIRQMELAAETAKGELVEHTGAGNDFHGWVDLPEAYDREEFARIQKAAAKIQAESEILVVAGIGGSYLGARAAKLIYEGKFGQMVVIRNNEITSIPLEESAGKLKVVDPNSSIVEEARLLGLSFGDR